MPTTASSRSSARAAWGSSGRPATSSSRGTSRSRSCRKGSRDDPDRRAFFEREAKAVAALHHPNIVTIYAIAEAENVRFFTMELVDGKPLSKLIVPGGVPLDLFFKIAVPLADAVAAAHERGIIHRDLKPRNIMIDPAGKVKILDFGLARILEPVPAIEGIEKAKTATLEEAFTGTISYMSPEQLRNEALDHRTDIFSLGIILYELATGEHPVRRENHRRHDRRHPQGGTPAGVRAERQAAAPARPDPAALPRKRPPEPDGLGRRSPR